MVEPVVDTETRDQRSLEQALADLRAKCEKRPTAQLAQMVEQLETTIAAKKTSAGVAIRARSA